MSIAQIDQFAIAAWLSLLFRIVSALTTPLIMLIAAKKLMSCPPLWPAQVIGSAAVYSLLMHIPYIMIHPIMQNFGLGFGIETYVKLTRILYPLSWLVSLASSFAMLSLCMRLARISREFNERSGSAS